MKEVLVFAYIDPKEIQQAHINIWNTPLPGLPVVTVRYIWCLKSGGVLNSQPGQFNISWPTEQAELDDAIKNDLYVYSITALLDNITQQDQTTTDTTPIPITAADSIAIQYLWTGI